MFRLFRFFAIVSLFVLALGALALSIFYRQSAVQDLMRVEQDKNVALTRAFANTLWPEFTELLGDSAALDNAELRSSAALLGLDAALRQQMTGLNIVRVKIYELGGRTLYSSQLDQIGENQAQNAGLLAAAGGAVVNVLTHRDEFNALDGTSENRDVLASYLPLRRTPEAEVEAVFELYSDVTLLLDDIDRVQWRISAGVVLILGMLYAALLSVVLYAQRIIRQQYAERARAEATLAASEERMRALVQSMRDVVFTVDLSGRYTGFYGRAIDEYDLLSGSAVGKTPAEVFDPPTAQLHADAIRRALANENVVFDWEIATGDRQVYLQTSLSPVINRAGALSGLVGVGRDYSELKRLEQMKTEFVANVSHELRTPLASILGYTEIVLQGRPGPLNEIQQEFLQTILESGKRLKLLVDDLLDVSKIEVGKFRMQFDKTDLTACIQGALEAIQPVAARSSVDIEVALPATLPTITADAQRIGQVLDNLLSNAVKYSKAGGSIAVRVTQVDGAVSIAVADSGIGIAPEDIPHLFTRFYRAANVTASKRTGTGLGLYITKAIVDGHGGHIEVESELGQGCTFRVWLPVVQAAPSPAIGI